MWTTYLLLCADGSLYCGATNDLEKRIKTHNRGKGSKYTRARLPVVLFAKHEGLTKSQALRLECWVKKQKKQDKKKELEREVGLWLSET